MYFFNWSNIFPDLTFSVYLFFGITFLISFVLGYQFQKKWFCEFKAISQSNKTVYIFSILVIAYIIEFIYNKGIPLIMVLNGSFNYKLFGIKYFHVLVLTFSGFYTTYLFHQYLSTNKKVLLYYIIILCLLNLLIINRGSILFTISQCLMLLIIKINKFRIKHLFFTFIFLLTISFLFGFFGNIRSGHGNKYFIPIETGANKQFMESSIPKEFYWTYIYIASPLANFQNNINKNNETSTAEDKIVTIITNTLPESLSRRIIHLFKLERIEKNYLINENLIVSTTFNDSYIYLHWYGPYLLFFILNVFIILYLFVIKNNSIYFFTAFVTLINMVVFSVFDNMWAFTGLSLQLLYPLLLSYFERKEIIL